MVAVATVKGTGDSVAAPAEDADSSAATNGRSATIPSDRGGANDYDPGNAWTDADGASCT